MPPSTDFQRPQLLVIALIPPALRVALARDNDLADHVIEGAPEMASTIPAGFDAVVTRALFGAPPEVLAALPGLRVIISLGAGADRIDLDALKARGIALIHTPDELTEDVADYVIGLMYAAQRNIVGADRFVRSGQWETSRFSYSRRVSSRRIGILGLGRIGERVARKAAALGLEIAYTGRRARPDVPYAYFENVDALAASVDILAITCARTPETHSLVSPATLRALGPQGILINVARGEVVQEAALIEALRTGTIAAAALDVFQQEPKPNPELLTLDNLILSPHAAALTEETREAMNDRLVQSTRAFFETSAS